MSGAWAGQWPVSTQGVAQQGCWILSGPWAPSELLMNNGTPLLRETSARGNLAGNFRGSLNFWTICESPRCRALECQPSACRGPWPAHPQGPGAGPGRVGLQTEVWWMFVGLGEERRRGPSQGTAPFGAHRGRGGWKQRAGAAHSQGDARGVRATKGEHIPHTRGCPQGHLQCSTSRRPRPPGDLAGAAEQVLTGTPWASAPGLQPPVQGACVSVVWTVWYLEPGPR